MFGQEIHKADFLQDVVTRAIHLRSPRSGGYSTAKRCQPPYSALTFTVLPFTFPADNLRTASAAMLRATAT